MPLDPAIGLQTKTPDFMSPAQAISLQNLVQTSQLEKMQIAAATRDLQNRNLILDAYRQPDALDPQTGMPTKQTLVRLSQIDPEYAQKAAATAEQAQFRLAQQRDMANNQIKFQQEQNAKHEAEEKEIVSEALAKAEIVASHTDNPEVINQALRQGLTDAVQRRIDSGNSVIGEKGLRARLAKPPTYEQAKAMVSSPKEIVAQREKQKADIRADKNQERAEKREERADRREERADKRMEVFLKDSRPSMTESQAKLHGDEFLNTLPAGDRQLIKNIADLKIDPNSLSVKGGHRERILSQVAQYKPDYQQTDYAESLRAVKSFADGKQGNSVRAFNVALEHLDTLQEVGDALKNKDVQLLNRASNAWKTQTGRAAPTDFNAVKQLVADEVVKAIVGSGGGVHDREEAAKTISAISSPEQLAGVIKRYKQLFGGQLKGLEQQYKAATKRDDFKERYLTEKGREAAAHDEPRDPSKKAGPYSDPDKEKRYQEWKKKNGY